MNNTDRIIIKQYDLEMGRLHGAITPNMNRETLISSIEILQKFLLMPDDVKLERAKKYFNDPEPF
jgi:hypothetical protein